MRKTQRERVLERLKAGGLNSYEATYEMRIKQAPARIKELREEGYTIVSKPNKKNRSVDWVLVDEPKSKRPYKMVIGEDNIARKVYI